MYGRVSICGVDTSRLPKLTAKETAEAIRRIKEGDAQAEQTFLTANLRLVLSVVKRFSSRSNQTDDLFQVGCVGLIKAVRNFDLSHNVRFSTYAVPMIIGEIRRFLRDDSAVRVSRSTRDMAYRAMQARDRLFAEKQHEVTNAEIAADLGEPLSLVENALAAVVDPVSIYEPVFSGTADALSVGDVICDESAKADKWITNLALREAMKHLSERERNIIARRYYAGRTQMEIADEIGISQAQVSRLEKGALDKLRRQIRE